MPGESPWRPHPLRWRPRGARQARSDRDYEGEPARVHFSLQTGTGQACSPRLENEELEEWYKNDTTRFYYLVQNPKRTDFIENSRESFKLIRLQPDRLQMPRTENAAAESDSSNATLCDNCSKALQKPLVCARCKTATNCSKDCQVHTAHRKQPCNKGALQ
jgi:hypothetical protein